MATSTATSRARSSVAVPSGSHDTASIPSSSSSRNHYAYTSSSLSMPSSPTSFYTSSSSSSSSSSSLTPALYLSRMMDVSQMDLQSGLDTMRSLLFVPPLHLILSSSHASTSTSSVNQVGKMAYYRWQTKGHWARDDPSVVFLTMIALVIMGIAYAIAFRNDSIWISVLYFGLWHSVLLNYLAFGIIMACCTKAVADGYLSTLGSGSTSSTSATQKQKVEWMYAFDIHCNAFVPFFALVYVVQFFLLPLVLTKGFAPFLASNILHSLAFGYYFYMTQLGYRALPFLSNTEVFLFPICIVVFIFLLNLIGYPFGFGWNASRIMAHVYFERNQY